MHKHLQNVLLVATIIFAYVWLQVPALQNYSLQAFAGAILIYFLLKRLRNAKIWHVMPADTSVEMILLTLAFLLLIGSTGNLNSYFYPFTYLHLFLLVMTTAVSTAVTGTIAVMVFHYALSPNLTSFEVGALGAFPLLLLFFLFAKRQYDEVRIEKEIIMAEKEEIQTIEASEETLENYLEGYLRPKLQTIHSLLNETNINPAVIKSQLELLESESNKILNRVKTSNSSAKAHMAALSQQDHDPET